MLFVFFFKILFFPFSPQSTLVHSCIFFVVGPSSCGMWDAASVWFDEQCHVRAQDSNQQNTGPPAAERANLTTQPRGQPPTAKYFNSQKCKGLEQHLAQHLTAPSRWHLVCQIGRASCRERV